MKSSSIFLSLLSLVQALPAPDANIQCASGVHIIAARGTNEKAGEGRLQNLSNQIESAIPGSTDEPVVYPANGLGPLSEPAGVKNLRTLIQNYVSACPNAQLVLSGYSQGAEVVFDLLGGDSVYPTTALDEKYRSNILAAVVFGDPTRQPNKTYNYGGSNGYGVIPRLATKQLDSYAAHLGSWCTPTDIFCDAGYFNITAHTTEVETWTSDAAKFVKKLWDSRA